MHYGLNSALVIELHGVLTLEGFHNIFYECCDLTKKVHLMYIELDDCPFLYCGLRFYSNT